MEREQYIKVYNYIETLTEEQAKQILNELVEQDPDTFTEHYIYYEYLQETEQ